MHLLITSHLNNLHSSAVRQHAVHSKHHATVTARAQDLHDATVRTLRTNAIARVHRALHNNNSESGNTDHSAKVTVSTTGTTVCPSANPAQCPEYLRALALVASAADAEAEAARAAAVAREATELCDDITNAEKEVRYAP